jgi:hypothetical protein
MYGKTKSKIRSSKRYIKSFFLHIRIIVIIQHCFPSHFLTALNFIDTFATSCQPSTVKMLFNTLISSSLFIASAVAVASPAPYKLASMSYNNIFGLTKRQAGYQPTQTYCNPGDTCAEACGAGYETCPSSDGDLHCYDPTIKQACCPVSSFLQPFVGL